MRRLSKRHEIHFIVLPPFRTLSEDLFLHQRHFHLRNREVVTKHQGIIAHYLPIALSVLKMWKKSRLIAFLWTSVSLLLNILKCMQKTDPEIVILNYPSPYTGFLGFIAGKVFLNKHILLDFNDLIAQYTIQLLDLKQSSLLAKLCLLIQDFIVANSDIVTVPTNYIKRYALNLAVSREKIILIPNGVDTTYFDPQKYSVDLSKSQLNLSGKRICLYCGRLDGWAGINIVWQLCEVFDTGKSNVCFVIVGSGTKEKRPFAENALVIGEVPYEKVPEILVVADVVLVPFPDNEVSRAASPLKLFEGMAMGKAIVASKVDGIQEVIANGENGVLVDANNISEWIKAIKTLMSDSSMLKRIGENAKRTVKKKYDWELLTKKYEETLQKKAIRGMS